jgi:hypothetical protein
VAKRPTSRGHPSIDSPGGGRGGGVSRAESRGGRACRNGDA